MTSDSKSNVIPFPLSRTRRGDVCVRDHGNSVFQLVRVHAGNRVKVIDLILASLNAGDVERERIIEQYLDDLPLEISSPKIRDKLRWKYWRGLTLVDEKKQHSDRFISKFKHACALLRLS